ETVGFIFSIASIGSLLGAILYQNVLKDHPFRNLLFWTQLLSGFAGMLDLILVLRLNLFAVIDKSVIQMIGRLKWMPLLVLSSKLCPPGIEGTFFALLMSIDNLGTLSSSWGVAPLMLLFLIPAGDPNASILPIEIMDVKEETGNTENNNLELVSLVSSTDDMGK
ncbi:Probable folate-biopterin transporter 2, partial [Linum perenne]